MIIDDLVKQTLEIIDESLRVVDIGISLSYTYCIVEGRRGLALGLAHTTYDRVFHGLKDDFSLKINELPKMVSSLKLIEKTVGLALLNAISQYILFNRRSYESLNNIVFGKDILEVIDIPPTAKILVVGYIKPVINKLRKQGYRNIYVVERDPPTRFEDIYSDMVFPRIAGKVDVVLITGATLVNDTLDIILKYATKARKVIVGPSAQVLPQLLHKYGIYVVGSIRVQNVWKVAEIVRRAGGTRAILKYSEKYVYIGQ